MKDTHTLRADEMRVVERLRQSSELFRRAFDFEEKLIKEVCDPQVASDIKAIENLAQSSHSMIAHQAVSRKTGGIDLSTINKDLQTKYSNGEIKFHIDPAMLARLKSATGFTPVIVNMRPLRNLPEYLGLTDYRANNKLGSLT